MIRQNKLSKTSILLKPTYNNIHHKQLLYIHVLFLILNKYIVTVEVCSLRLIVPFNSYECSIIFLQQQQNKYKANSQYSEQCSERQIIPNMQSIHFFKDQTINSFLGVIQGIEWNNEFILVFDEEQEPHSIAFIGTKFSFLKF